MEKQYYFQTKHMTVGYGGVPLIRNVEIALEQGEILTLIGPNGAGKSTILKSIAGQLMPVGGGGKSRRCLFAEDGWTYQITENGSRIHRPFKDRAHDV